MRRSSLADAANAAAAPRASRRLAAPKEFSRRCVAPPSLLIKSRRRAAERGAALLLPLLTQPAPLLPFECVMKVGSLEEKKGTCGHSVAAIIVLLSPLDCIEAICAFAKLGVAALLPLPMPLTLRHSSSACRGGAASKGESRGESIAAIRWAASNAELTACQITDALMLPLFYGRVGTACGFQKGSPRQRCRRSSCRRQRLVISRWHAHS